MESVLSNTVIAVGIMLSTAAFASAIAWGIIGAKMLEGIARQPEMRPVLLTNTFILGGLMESFPFITLAIAMWFTFANPFLG